MNALLVTVECHHDRVSLHAEIDGARHEASAKQPLGAAFSDILGQLHRRGTPPGAYRAAGEHVGRVLFSGAVGDALRDALRVEPERTLALTLDPRVAEWPWELAIDPETGRHPVAAGAEIVRLGGDPVPRRAVPAIGVLAVPEGQGHARLEALEAATRHLGRKTQLEIQATVPATGPNLRQRLAQGAALVHLTSVEEDGVVELDDGRVPIERVGITDSTWLTVLAGRGTTHAAARRLRRNGSALVLALQIELRTNERAAVDRELYRALAAGAPLLDAIRRARRALLRSAGEDACAWAAPVLWCAPSDGVEIFAQPFPPPKRMDSAIAAAPTIAQPIAAGPITSGPTADLDGPVGVPVAAAVFVHDTLHAIRMGADAAALEVRVEALHALAAGALVDPGALGGPADQLIEQLLDAIARPDAPLVLPPEVPTFAASIADRAAVAEETAGDIVRALLTGTSAWITDDDPPGALRAARFVTEAFGYHPILPAHREAPVCGATPGGPHGALYRAIALNWRRDQLDPAHAAHPDPTQRIPMMVRRRDRWHPRTGAWLVLPQAHRLPAEDIDAVLRALDEGELWFTDAAGRPQRMAVPRDFRVLFVGAPPFAPLSSAVAVVTPGAPGADVERRRWSAYAGRHLGPVADAQEADARAEVAESLQAILNVARISGPVPSDVGALALAHALLDDLDGALRVHLAPLMAQRAAAGRALLADWLEHGPKAAKVKGWANLEGGEAVSAALAATPLPPAVGGCPGLVRALRA